MFMRQFSSMLMTPFLYRVVIKYLQHAQMSNQKLKTPLDTVIRCYTVFSVGSEVLLAPAPLHILFSHHS